MNLSPHLGYEEEAHAGGKVLKFAGEADFLAVPAVRQLLKGLLGQKIPLLIVDPSGVTFPGGEPMAAMAERAVRAIRDLDARVASEYGPDAVWLACSHGDSVPGSNSNSSSRGERPVPAPGTGGIRSSERHLGTALSHHPALALSTRLQHRPAAFALGALRCACRLQVRRPHPDRRLADLIR